jgi:Ca2+-dependent lipid-binding protein
MLQEEAPMMQEEAPMMQEVAVQSGDIESTHGADSTNPGLIFTIVESRRLRCPEQSSQVFCNLIFDGKTHATKTIEGTDSPAWGTKFVLFADSMPDERTVRLEVHDANYVHQKKNLGGITIALPKLGSPKEFYEYEAACQLTESGNTCEEVDINDIDWSQCSDGLIIVRFQYVACVRDCSGERRAAFVGQVIREAKERDNSIGRAKLTIVRAKGLSRTESNKLVDPFVVLTYRGQKTRTKVELNTCKPVWNQEFEFAVKDVTDSFEVEWCVQPKLCVSHAYF